MKLNNATRRLRKQRLAREETARKMNAFISKFEETMEKIESFGY